MHDVTMTRQRVVVTYEPLLLGPSITRYFDHRATIERRRRPSAEQTGTRYDE